MEKIKLLYIFSLIMFFIGCNKNKPDKIKIWPSIDNTNIILRQTGINDFIIIDKINNKLITAKIDNDTLIRIKSLAINDKIKDATKYKNIIAFSSESTIYIYDIEKMIYINKINIEIDTFITPYSIHKYFNLKLVDSLLYIENYCIECANRPLSGLIYPVERCYNIYSGKYNDIYIELPYTPQKYYLRIENFISRVYINKYSYYTFLNSQSIVRYSHLDNISNIIYVKEKENRDIYMIDSSEAELDYYTFARNSMISNTSNQAIFYDNENNYIYNFKFLGQKLNTNQIRIFVLQKIDLNGNVLAEYKLKPEDCINLIFYKNNPYIENIKDINGKTIREYEKINI